MTTTAEDFRAPPADRFRDIRFDAVKLPAPRATHYPRRINPSDSIFAQQFSPRSPILSPADRLLLDQILLHHKLSAAAYRQRALIRRVPACLRALQSRSSAEAQRRLQTDSAAADLAINAVLIGVTAFFRDTAVFDQLRAAALPQLLAVSPAPRILSVGCSDGAELVSLGICLRESGATHMELRGIDCRRRAIHRARTGLYPHPALAGLPTDLRHRYFRRLPHYFELRPELRHALSFQQADALTCHLPRSLDFIACRNLSIYLEHPAAARLWRRLHLALRPGGWLLTGKAERPTAGFLRAGSCLFRKAGP